MTSRRSFLKYSAALGAAAPLLSSEAAKAAVLGLGEPYTHASPGPSLWENLVFAQPLPIPPVAAPYAISSTGVPQYKLVMRPLFKRVLPKVTGYTTRPTRMFGYTYVNAEGVESPVSVPGPTIIATRGRPVQIEWVNRLGGNGMAPVRDTVYTTTVRGYNGPRVSARLPVPAVGTYNDNLNPNDTTVQPDPRIIATVSHLHGQAFVAPASDGVPENVYECPTSMAGPLTSQQTSLYPNNQDAAPLWYHDHALGRTRLNVYAGLAGGYIITDPAETASLAAVGIVLPEGNYDIPLIIQDKQLLSDGSRLLYTVNPLTTTTLPWLPEVFGDILTVNGAFSPYLDVEPRPYRFRVYNGCGSRFLKLGISQGNYKLIGSDQGLFRSAAPAAYTHIGPGQRLDVVIDFSNYANTVLELRNTAESLVESNTEVFGNQLGRVLQFRVGSTALGTTTVMASIGTLRTNIPSPSAVTPAITRNIVLHEVPTTRLLNPGPPATYLMQPLINKRTYLVGGIGTAASDPGRPMTRPTTAPRYERWNVVNLTVDMHPFHLHLLRMQVIQRQTINTGTYGPAFIAAPMTPESDQPNPYSYATGTPTVPTPTENGWLDTIQIPSGQVTSILVEIPVNCPAGTYPFHCHILEHEDFEMMRKFQIT